MASPFDIRKTVMLPCDVLRLLDTFWAPFGMLLGRLVELVLKPLWASRGLFVGPLGVSFGSLGGLLGPAGYLGNQLGPEGSKCELEFSLMDRYWGNLEPSWALLEPS